MSIRFKQKRQLPRLISVLLLAVLVVGMLPVMTAKADVTDGLGTGTDIGSGATTTYQRDRNYVEVTASDVDVWDNGIGISVSNGSGVASIGYYGYTSYTVLISKYMDTDGEYVVQVDVFLYGSSSYVPRCLLSEVSYVADDGSVCANAEFFLYSDGINYACDPATVCFAFKGDLWLNESGEWQETPGYALKVGGNYRTPIYLTPFYSGKYVVYNADSCTAELPNGYVAAFNTNLLPNAPQNASNGDTSIPYKTTFRMLNGNETVYNTYYYTSCYQSGADTISAAGTIRLDATVLATGAVTRIVLTAPQLLCQISTYGTAYDIAYTNDDTLCELLGISMPSTSYEWDTAAQQWVVSSGSSSGSGSSSEEFHFSSSLSLAENFALWLASEGHPVLSGIAHTFAFESLGDFDDLFEKYLLGLVYVPANGGFAWRADLIESELEETVDFSEAPDTEAAEEDVRKHLRITPNNTYVWSLSDSSGSGSDSSGSGSDSSGSGSDSSGSSGSGSSSSGSGSTDLSVPDLEPAIDSIQQGIADGVSTVGGFLSGVLGSAGTILGNLGSIPAMLSELFGFLPAEFVSAIGVGLSLWLLPSLLGLARSGLKALGGLCSSLFSFISSFF